MKTPRRPLFLYAAYSPAAKLIKIGLSAHPSRRLESLQYAHGQQLILLAHHSARGFSARVAEKNIHRRLKDYRQLGEWFRETPEVLAVVEQMKAAQLREAEERTAAGTISPADRCPWCGHREPSLAQVS